MVAIELLYLSVSLNSFTGSLGCGSAFGFSCCCTMTVSATQKFMTFTYTTTPSFAGHPLVTCPNPMVLFCYNNR